jgi:hypothetical protein
VTLNGSRSISIHAIRPIFERLVVLAKCRGVLPSQATVCTFGDSQLCQMFEVTKWPSSRIPADLLPRLLSLLYFLPKVPALSFVVLRHRRRFHFTVFSLCSHCFQIYQFPASPKLSNFLTMPWVLSSHFPPNMPNIRNVQQFIRLILTIIFPGLI